MGCAWSVRSLVAVCVLGSISHHGAYSAPSPRPESPAAGKYARPFAFEPNVGQEDGPARFLSRASGYQLAVEPAGITLALWHPRRSPDPVEEFRAARWSESPASTLAQRPGPDPAHVTLRMELVGANPSATSQGEGPLPARISYFVGKDPSRWHVDVPTFARVRCRDIYPGVDLVYYGSGQELEYDFVVSPGADPGRISLRFSGAESMRLLPDGDLLLHTPGGDVRWRTPVLYQSSAGYRKPVTGRYILDGRGKVSFRVGDYDRSRPLVIDPTLAFSTYFGVKNVDEQADAVTTDAAGNAYVTGTFDSAASSMDAYILKFAPNGDYLGGAYLGGKNGTERGLGIALDGQGNITLTGYTDAIDFPLLHQVQDTLLSHFATFVCKVNAAMNGLLYSTYLGGGQDSEGTDVACDAAGNAAVIREGHVGTAASFAYVTLFGPAGQKVWEKSITGQNNAFAGGVAMDGGGNVWATGETQSTDMTTVNPVQATYGGDFGDVFIAHFAAGDGSLLYSTFYGGKPGEEMGMDVALDQAGNVYVTGQTFTCGTPKFPVVNAFQATPGGGCDEGFVMKLTPDGSQVLYATYLGGSGNDLINRITADAQGNAFVTGKTSSPDFPRQNALYDAYQGGTYDAFVTELGPDGALLFSTYLGGSDRDEGWGIASDPQGNVWVTGWTMSGNFPTAGPAQTALGGGEDAFIARLATGAAPPPKLGDANGDGVVNAADVMAILQAAGGEAPVNLAVMDVNQDGRVDPIDAGKLLRFVDGLDPNL